MNRCAVLIPVYKPGLSAAEEFSVRVSLRNLAGHDVYWIAPESLPVGYYRQTFGAESFVRYPDDYFRDVQGYSRLLVSDAFYARWSDYEFVLVCQTDAIVLRPDLGRWLEQPYDYIGAPWPSGYSLDLKPAEVPIPGGIRCTAFVGNGGLSLRRVDACIRLIQEFRSISAEWYRMGHAEDLYFGFLGTISKNFVIPNVATAARFSHDIDPGYLQELIGGELPFGIHAWEKYDRKLCEKKFDEAGIILNEKLDAPLSLKSIRNNVDREVNNEQ